MEKMKKNIYIAIIILISAAAVFASTSVDILFFDTVKVKDDIIRLRDIADISIKEGESREEFERMRQIEVGRSAPPGYSRFINSRDLVNYRLGKISGDIDWNISSHKRIHISTLGREAQLVDYKDQIYGYMMDNIKWEKNDYSLEILENGKKITIYDIPADVKVEGLESGYPRGAVRLSLTFIQNGKEKREAFRCMVKVEAEVVVSNDYIKKGETIRASSLSLEKKDITEYRNDFYTEKEKITGSLALRSIKPGVIMREILVVRKPAVEKGESFSLFYSRGSVSIEIPVRARENGHIGEKIWVENIKSHKLLRLKLVKKGERIIGIREVL